MMVLLVDDDSSIRQGLKTQLEQMFPAQLEFREAANGAAALAMLPALQPQVVVTDICMPDMDGLELIHQVRNRGLDPYFLIVSGHSDFPYARKAIQYNVTDFLVKPIDEGDLFRNFSAILEREARIHQKAASSLQAERLSHYLKRGIRTGFSPELTARYPEFSLTSLFPWPYFTVLVTPAAGISFPQRDGVPFSLQEAGYAGNLCAFELQKGLYVWLLCSDAPISAFPSSLLGKFGLSPEVGTTWGESCRNCALENLSQAVAQAQAAAYLCIYGKTGILCYGDIPLAPVTALNPGEYQRKLNALVGNGNIREAQSLVTEMYAIAGKKLVNPKAFLDTCKHILLRLEDSLDREDRSELPAELERLDTLCRFSQPEEISACLREIVGRQADLAAPVYSFLVGKMIRYVRDHITQPIELKTIAVELDKGQNYLGAIFKKEMGINFSNYVLQQKMELAGRLIDQDPNIKIYELASRIGYTDEKYFAKMFKNYYGVTPGQMKATRKNHAAQHPANR